MVNNDPYLESIPAYALGCLDPVEREQLEQHLSACPQCQADLRAYQALSEDLALAVPARLPPAHLKQAILQNVSRPIPLPPQVVAESWWRRFFRTFQPAWGVVSLVLILALSASMIYFWQQSRTPPDVQNTFHVIELTSPDNSPQQASALLVIDNIGHYGSLVTDKLKPLGNTQQYQLWLIKDNVRTNGGVFSVNNSGYGWLKVESSVSLLQYRSFGVTIEPKGGSPGPTGPKVLGGNFSPSK